MSHSETPLTETNFKQNIQPKWDIADITLLRNTISKELIIEELQPKYVNPLPQTKVAAKYLARLA